MDKTIVVVDPFGVWHRVTLTESGAEHGDWSLVAAGPGEYVVESLGWGVAEWYSAAGPLELAAVAAYVVPCGGCHFPDTQQS